MSDRSVSHFVEVLMAGVIWSGFDSEKALRSTERLHGSSVLQGCTPNVP